MAKLHSDCQPLPANTRRWIGRAKPTSDPADSPLAEAEAYRCQADDRAAAAANRHAAVEADRRAEAEAAEAVDYIDSTTSIRPN